MWRKFHAMCIVFLFNTTPDHKMTPDMCLSSHLTHSSSHLSPSGVGGAAAEHPAARAGPARDQVEGDTPRLQPLLPRGEAGVVVALHRRPPGSDPCLHALPRVHVKRHRRGEFVHPGSTSVIGIGDCFLVLLFTLLCQRNKEIFIVGNTVFKVYQPKEPNLIIHIYETPF